MAKTLTDIYVGVKKNSEDRNTNDLYRTPPLATYILQKYSNIPHNVVEPCAGYGNIAIELERHGHNVKCFDLNQYPEALCQIQTGMDVLALDKQLGYDALITNPPYHQDIPRKLVQKALTEYDYVAVLVRLTFLEGKKRKALFDKHTPTKILIFSDRIKFDNKYLEPIEKQDQIGGMIAYAWVIWDKTDKIDHTVLKWVLLEDEYPEWREKYNKQLTN